MARVVIAGLTVCVLDHPSGLGHLASRNSSLASLLVLLALVGSVLVQVVTGHPREERQDLVPNTPK